MLEPSKNGLAWIDDLTGGLNTTDPPAQIGDNQLQSCVNIEWTQTRVAQRRQGGQNNIGTEPWGAGKSLVSAWRHTPSNDETAAELFGMDTSATVILGRLTASANFAAVTASDAISNAPQADLASFNGKAWIAYDSAVDRLHVWDGAALRRAGLPKPVAAPTVANTGAGAYAATQRWYKVVFYNFSGTATTGTIWSVPSDAVSFTPSGAGTAARITRPTAPGEHEDSWGVLASPDNINFYFIAAVTLATTTYDDSAAPNTYATVNAIANFPADLDYFTVPPSPKFLLVHGARMLLCSSWETTAYQSRVWFTPILRTSSFGGLITSDDERVPSSNYLDLDPTDGGGLTGVALLNGSPYAFKGARFYKLDATINATKPYSRTVISRRVGALSHRSIVLAEDDAGNECLYFLSRRGPYRYGPYGLEFLGRDLEYGTWSAMNKSPSTKPFGVYHEQKHQIWWWVGSGNTPDTVLVLSIPFAKRQEDGVVRGGWTTFTGDIATALAAVMFSKTLAATMSLDLKPYVAQVNNGTTDPDGPLVMYDADAVTTDGGARATTYNATFKTKAFPPGGRDKRGGLLEAFITAQATGRTLNVSARKDYGAETALATVSIAQAGSINRDDVKVENLTVGDCKVVEILIDDVDQGARPWLLDSIGLRLKEEGGR